MINDSSLNALHKTQSVFLSSIKSKTPESGARTLETIGKAVPYSEMAKDLVSTPDSLNTTLETELKNSFGPEVVQKYQTLLKTKQAHISLQSDKSVSALESSNMVLSALEAIKSSMENGIKESRIYRYGEAISEANSIRYEQILRKLNEDEKTEFSAKAKVLATTAIVSSFSLIVFIFHKLYKAITIGKGQIASGNIPWISNIKASGKTNLLLIALVWACSFLVITSLSKISKEKEII